MVILATEPRIINKFLSKYYSHLIQRHKIEGVITNILIKINTYACFLIMYPKTNLQPSKCLQCKVRADLGDKQGDFGRMRATLRIWKKSISTG